MTANDAEMLCFVKRWAVFIIITAICLILITTLNGKFLPRSLSSSSSSSAISRNSCPPLPPNPPFIPPENDRFNWRNVIIKHPVNTFTSIPASKPITLPKVQFQFKAPSAQAEATKRQRKDAVKQVFRRCWDTYRKKAWLSDELAPVSGGSKNTFGGWGATLVDSLDTLWIMDMKDEFQEAVTAAVNISFSPESSSLETLNMFETTIRYLGGFLAAYDQTDCKDERLLSKAVEMGDMIYTSYDTPNRMPVTRWNPKKADEEQPAADHGIIAEMASSSLEFTRLSQLTGDMRYYDAIARIANVLDEQQNQTKLPGMFPINIDVQTPDLTFDTSFGFGAMADSAFEYFGKTYQLLGGQEKQYQKLYESAMGTAIEHLLFRPMLPDKADVLISGIYHSDSGTDTQAQHLSCFTGGMYLLGGRLFDNQTHVDVGRKLTDGCVWAYKNSPLGIMPEIFKMNRCPSFAPCDWDPAQESAFTEIGDARYILRPEAIESVYYSYRITGDEKYQDMAWDMFQAIDKNTKTEFANAALRNVMNGEGEKDDSMESFWMGETLKYFYLLFSDPEVVSLDEFVFNTEAHPFRIPNRR